MAEPAYSFTIPSLADDIKLDCRIYHPSTLADVSQGVKAAVVAHPYAPLGGCYDDPVVMAVTETLLKQGYVVATFNFRGAGESDGKTSWTGRPEIEDYISAAGFTIYYAHYLSSARQLRRQSTPSDEEGPTDASRSLPVLLAGYSYGSLVLARLPQVTWIIERFHTAAMGTTAAEIMLRAKTLAKQTMKTLDEQSVDINTNRGPMLDPTSAATSSSANPRASPVIMGGEEMDSSERRRSRDSRRSVDAVRELPHKLKAHLRRSSETNNKHRGREGSQNMITPPEAVDPTSSPPAVAPLYLLVAPVILPLSNLISPPGAPALAMGMRKATAANSDTDLQLLKHPTLVLFGTRDAFTSSKRFLTWAQKQAAQSRGFEWEQIEGAGHFWREEGVMQALKQRVVKFVKPS